MSLTERERQTQVKYDMSASEWLDHSGGKDRPCFWAEEMKEFLLRLPETSRVLEVGCGPATDGKYLLQYEGLQCISIDYSAGMTALARELNPSQIIFQMDMQEMGFTDNSFNGFWATACLLHLEKTDKALRELVRVTKNRGVGFITVKEGDGEAVDPRTGYYFRYHQNPDFIRKLRYTGLETILSGRKAGSPNHDWLTYLVKVVK